MHGTHTKSRTHKSSWIDKKNLFHFHVQFRSGERRKKFIFFTQLLRWNFEKAHRCAASQISSCGGSGWGGQYPRKTAAAEQQEQKDWITLDQGIFSFAACKKKKPCWLKVYKHFQMRAKNKCSAQKKINFSYKAVINEREQAGEGEGSGGRTCRNAAVAGWRWKAGLIDWRTRGALAEFLFPLEKHTQA